MLTKIFRPSLVVGVLCLSVCASAHARDLIETLYHADFTPDTDDEIPRFTLDGELGVLVNTGNTSAASVKAAVNADHETENWSSIYLAELLYKESGSATTERDITPALNSIINYSRLAAAFSCTAIMRMTSLLAMSIAPR